MKYLILKKTKESADNGNVQDILKVGHMFKDGNGT